LGDNTVPRHLQAAAILAAGLLLLTAYFQVQENGFTEEDAIQTVRGTDSYQDLAASTPTVKVSAYTITEEDTQSRAIKQDAFSPDFSSKEQTLWMGDVAGFEPMPGYLIITQGRAEGYLYQFDDSGRLINQTSFTEINTALIE
jgi:hypothetical protein